MNISEIAKLAGVSASAVSRYLNDGYLSEEKKARIEKVIQETGYVPSRQAKTLRTGKTKLIGVIIPKIDSDSISRIVAGISEVLSKAGYQIILANVDNDVEKELEYFEIFKQTQVDGIIHLGTVKTPKHHKIFKESQIPIVVLGQEEEDAACVFHDDFNASLSLTRFAIEKGYRRIAYIGVTEKDVAVGYRRKAGFSKAMKEAGREGQVIAYEGSFRMDNGYENAQAILKEHKDVDAIICATDTIAMGVVKYLHEQGVSIPDQIAVAGMGDSRLASVISPSLTTVHYYYKECGQEGAKLLLEKMEDSSLLNKKIKLDCRVLEQGSM